VTIDRKGQGHGSSEAQRAWTLWREAWVNVEYWLKEAYDEDHLVEAREERSRLFEAFVMACRRARV
jgi:hypothetical protein